MQDAIAITGMAGRFPGAADVAEFWRNVRTGTESISFYTEDELRAEGFEEETLRDPDFVPAGGELAGSALFDAAFFGYSPREAELIDPQQRVFLECASTAMERANVVPGRDCRVGVLGGAGMNTYLLQNVLARPDLIDPASAPQIIISNDKDYLTLRVAYKLGLNGPALTVQTSCSSSLVAVHLGCRMLLTYDCDVVLAGGAAVSSPQRRGYVFRKGGVASPDGHCRAFDARAEGLAPGSGVGVVVLKRLEDAVESRDVIHAVIRGSAINNDGTAKVGFTAPSVALQAEVIAEALAAAQVEADSIGYVEAHGTATPLGDPIEMAALTRAFRRSTAAKQFCALGSVKTNIGHLDAAAGVAGLIKTALALEHRELPPSLNFEQPNPRIEFDDSPFYVNVDSKPWQSPGRPRRAGVSSFGLGGTNAHVVLEEAPPRQSSVPSRWPQLLLTSAKTANALATARQELADHLAAHTEADIADVAHTLWHGRRAYSHRLATVCTSGADAVDMLRQNVSGVVTGAANPPLIFLFPGVNAVPAGAGGELYQRYPVFRDAVDECARILRPRLDLDLAQLLSRQDAAETLARPMNSAAATFTIGYALARLLQSWQLTPRAMIGHSMGEYVAACVSGVLTLPDALRLVTLRYELLERIPAGAMLSVAQPEEALRPLLGEHLDIAAVNTATSTVVSGPVAAIDQLAADLAARGIEAVRLRVPVATHSALLDPVLAEFRTAVEATSFHEPKLPYVSSLTGTWMDPAEVGDPQYWVRQFRETVRFADALDTVSEIGEAVTIEVGPGRALTTLVRAHGNLPAAWPLMPTQRGDRSEMAEFLTVIGRLWQAGVDISEAAVAADEVRDKVELPTYPFERQSYWIGSGPTATYAAGPKIEYSAPSWRRAPLHQSQHEPRADAVFLVLAGPLGGGLSDRLHEHGSVVVVNAGTQFVAGIDRYTIDPGNPEHYARLLKSLDIQPTDLVHAWTLGAAAADTALGLPGLLNLVEAYDTLQLPKPRNAWLITDALQEVTGTEPLRQDFADLADAVLPADPTNPACHTVDVVLTQSPDQIVAAQIVSEIIGGGAAAVAYRGPHRWTRSLEPVTIDAPAHSALRTGGLYVLTGGLEDRAVFGGYLTDKYQARVVCVDATSRESVIAAVQGIRKEHGDIDGIIHPAHVLNPLDLADALDGNGPCLCLLHTGFDVPTRVENAVRSLNRDGGRWLVVGWNAGGDPGDLGEVLERVATVPEHGVLLVSLPGRQPTDNAPATGEEWVSRHARPALSTSYEPARNDIETQLVAIWEEVTGITPVGIRDDFFELGGHSLMGTQVVARLRAAFDIDFPLGQLFESSTIAEMAQVVVQLGASDTAGDDLEALLAEIEQAGLDPSETAADG